MFKLTPIHRQQVCDPVYIEKLDVTIEFSIGVSEDHDVILDYYETVAYQLKQVDKASKITVKQFRDYYDIQIDEWVSSPYTILAHCDGEICGLITGVVRSLNGQQKRPLHFKDDYEQDLLKYEGPNEPVRLLTCFFTEMQSFMSNFFQIGCNEYMRVHGLIVTPEFQGTGIATKLWKELLKLAFNNGVEFITSTSTSPPSVQIAKKFGMKTMFKYAYKDFKINGSPVFGHTLHDGSTELELLVGDLEEMKSKFID